jgi:hypothetical protein
VIGILVSEVHELPAASQEGLLHELVSYLVCPNYCKLVMLFPEAVENYNFARGSEWV